MKNFITDNEVCETLKKHEPVISAEIKSLPKEAFIKFAQVYKGFDKDGFVGDYESEESNVSKVEWTIFPLMLMNETHPVLKQYMPKTLEVLESLEVMVCYVSRFLPNMEVDEHIDGDLFQDYSRRYHVCAKTPKGKAALVVKGEPMIYEEGGVFGFNNSEIHSAYNRGSEERAILLLDVMLKGKKVSDLPPEILQQLADVRDMYVKNLDGM